MGKTSKRRPVSAQGSKGSPAEAAPEGGDLQTAFAVAIQALQTGQLAPAAAQFGMCFVCAEMALSKQEPEMQLNLKQYMWQCGLYRSACMSQLPRPQEQAEALKCLVRCVELAEELDDNEKLFESLSLRASLHVRLGHHQEGLADASRLEALAKESPSPEYEQAALLHKGKALIGLEQNDLAVEALRSCAALAAKREDARRETEAHMGLAKVLTIMGESQQAKESVDRAIQLAEREGPERVTFVEQALLTA